MSTFPLTEKPTCQLKERRHSNPDDASDMSSSTGLVLVQKPAVGGAAAKPGHTGLKKQGVAHSVLGKTTEVCNTVETYDPIFNALSAPQWICCSTIVRNCTGCYRSVYTWACIGTWAVWNHKAGRGQGHRGAAGMQIYLQAQADVRYC